MRASHWLGLYRLLALVALGVSAALLVDYLAPKPAFCGGASGCSAIRDSGVGTFSIFGLSVSLPIVGVASFAILFVLSLVPSVRVLSRGMAPLSLACGMGALGFIVWQAVLGSFCYLCMIVDVSAVLMAVCALRLMQLGFGDVLAEEQSESTYVDAGDVAAGAQSVPGVWRDDSQVYQPPNPPVQPLPRAPLRLSRSAWLSLLVLFVTAPLLYPRVVAQSEIPPSITELYGDGPTFVEFFDFQCPHCRDLSPRLKDLAQREGVPLVYAYRPLDQHPQARVAARMAICAGEQGKEAELAEKYFQQTDFSDEALLKAALEVVENDGAFSECLASKRPDQRVERDIQRLDEGEFLGLPTTYIGELRLLGALPTVQYEEALRVVRAGEDSEGLSPLSYWAVILVLLLSIVWSGRVRGGKNSRS